MKDYGIFEGLFTEITTPLINGTLGNLKPEAINKWKKRAVNNRAAKAYIQNLNKRYGMIQILGQSKPQEMMKVYTDVYLHDRPTSSYSMGIDQLEKSFQENRRFGRDERIDGLELAKQQERLFILGKPGSGKTTFLKYLALQALEVGFLKVPIFVSLNKLSNQRISIFDYLADQFHVSDFPDAKIFVKQLLQNGKGLILFDGLDEVKKQNTNRVKLTQDLKDFIDKYDRNQFVITCRIAASDYNFSGFKYVEMADFTDDQVERFAKGWFVADKIKSEKFLLDLEKPINQGMKEMSTSPLLLALLCIHYGKSSGFPPYRSEVYESALSVLLSDWDSSRSIVKDEVAIKNEANYQTLTTKTKMQLMSFIAYLSFASEDLFIKQNWLENKILEFLAKTHNSFDKDSIDGQLILREMESQHGLLVKRATRIYSFSNLAFQEYFVARYIIEHSSNLILKELMTPKKITDPRWREIILFVAELLPDSHHFALLFAQSLQAIAESRMSTHRLASWIEQRANERPIANRPMISRSSYLFAVIANLFNEAQAMALARLFTDENSQLISSDLVVSFVEALSNASDLANRNIISSKLAAESFDRFEIFRENFFEAIDKVIVESRKLGWYEFTEELTQLSMIKPSDQKDWKNIFWKLRQIEHVILFNKWTWISNSKNELQQDLDVIITWFNGHTLLFECLEKAIFVDINREEFEDEHLFKSSRVLRHKDSLPDIWLLRLDHPTRPHASIDDLKPEIDKYIQNLIDLQHILDDIDLKPRSDVQVLELTTGSVKALIEGLNAILTMLTVQLFGTKEQKERATNYLIMKFLFEPNAEVSLFQNPNYKPNQIASIEKLKEYKNAFNTGMSEMDKSIFEIKAIEYYPTLALVIEERFGKTDIQDLCFRLGINYEDFEGGLSTRTQTILDFIKTRNRLQDLIDYINIYRSDIELPFNQNRSESC